MRVRVLIESFERDDTASWVHALAAVINRAHQGDDPDAALALESITHAAADSSLAYRTRQRLYEAAASFGLPAIARLFLAASPNTASQSQLDKQLAPERALRPTDRPLTLGERKALARTHRRDKLTLLLRDPHPEVVAILLDNPHVTEPEVVRIAAGRPAVPESLAKIAAHHRWSVRHAVKRALVQNPMTPLADAIRIATTLSVHELEQLAQDPALPEPLRRHAADLRDASLRRSRA
ncbi:MAG: hypothetical protein AB7O24_25690 [Kofleriaceae bacterium]